MVQLKEIQKEFDVYLLHSVRDGRAVLNSYLKKRSMNVETVGNLWLKRITENESFFEKFSLGKKILLRYEELATRPLETTKEICNFLGIEFIPEMMSYWKHEHHMISGNAGTRSLISKHKNQSQIEDGKKTIDLSIKLDLSWQTQLT